MCGLSVIFWPCTALPGLQLSAPLQRWRREPRQAWGLGDSWAMDCRVVALCCQPFRPRLRLSCAGPHVSKCPAAQPPWLPTIPAWPAAQPWAPLSGPLPTRGTPPVMLQHGGSTLRPAPQPASAAACPTHVSAGSQPPSHASPQITLSPGCASLPVSMYSSVLYNVALFVEESAALLFPSTQPAAGGRPCHMQHPAHRRNLGKDECTASSAQAHAPMQLSVASCVASAACGHASAGGS